MSARAPFKVAINAQILPGGGGGVKQFIIGLVHGLGQLDGGPEEYIIIGPWQEPDWLEPYLGPNQRIVPGPKPRLDYMEWAKSLLGPLRSPAGGLRRRVRGLIFGSSKSFVPSVPESGGFYESLDVDVVHFPYQKYVKCSLPTIYNPHDLQHLHYPQFFTQEEIAWRETIYPAGCRHARAIAVESEWVKDDIIRQYSIDPKKICVFRWGSPTELFNPVTEKTLVHVRQRFQLPETFALYPATTWEHKNHLRLLDAIKLLRDRDGLSIDLICTGPKHAFWPTIEQHVRELKLSDQVRFLGFVTPTELRALYHLAQFVVFPSLFEGGGFPVVEAFQEGTPVACSAATSLTEYGGNAVLFFDPVSVESIAEAMRRMSTDAELRATLSRRGSARMRLFNWERMAKTHRALYRKVAGRPLSDEECHLLGNDWDCTQAVDSVKEV